KPFYEGLVSYITSGPIVAMVLEGKKAVSVARNVIGATNPADAAPGTIRGDLALEIGRNVVHGSDSPASAEREIKIFFKEDELLKDWKPSVHKWVAE
ncbi:MAG TPA: nucleoside-diphosphate kinase, partial [Trichormus sp.]